MNECRPYPSIFHIYVLSKRDSVDIFTKSLGVENVCQHNLSPLNLRNSRQYNRKNIDRAPEEGPKKVLFLNSPYGKNLDFSLKEYFH